MGAGRCYTASLQRLHALSTEGAHEFINGTLRLAELGVQAATTRRGREGWWCRWIQRRVPEP